MPFVRILSSRFLDKLRKLRNSTHPSPAIALLITAVLLMTLTQSGCTGLAGSNTGSGGTSSNGAAAPTISIQPINQTVALGQTASFSVTATGGSTLIYQWKKNGAPISGATSSSYLTPPVVNSDSGSQYSVLVSDTSGNITSNFATLTVSANGVAVSVTPNNTMVMVGRTQQFIGTVTGTSNTNVIWTVSGPGCAGAACGTISAAGLYAPAASLPSPATVTVKATSVADPTKSASAGLTIVAVAAVFLSVSPTSAVVPTTGTETLVATVTGTSNTGVTWALRGSGCSGSACGTLATSGLTAVYSAPPVAPAPASVSVVATSMIDPTVSATAAMTVEAHVRVGVSPADTSVVTGTSQQFSADVTGTSSTAVSWSVTGTNCAGAACGTIDASGRFAAPSALPSPPVVTVTATSTADSTQTATASVTIVSPASPSTANGLNIPGGHPRLFWNASRLAQAQRWWASHSYTPNTANTNPFDPYDTLFACMMSNNAAACSAQINWATSLNEGACYQTVGCDSMRVYGEAVMLTYDWLYSQMTTAQRATMKNKR